MSNIPKDIQEKFDWVISFMAIKDRFCFEVLSMCDKVAVEGFGTMGVCPSGSRIKLFFDPIFFRSLEIEELRYVLIHEVMHIVLHHLTHRRPHDPREHKLYNVAMDFAINSIVDDSSKRYMPRYKEDQLDSDGTVLAKKGDLMGLRPNMPRYSFEPRLSTESYVKLLRDKFPPKKDEKENEGRDDVTGGTDKASGKHEGWGPNELVDDKIRRKIEHLDRTNSWGELSESFKEMVRAAQRTEVPWRKLLKHEYGMIISSELRPTFKKPDRRFGYPYSSKVRKYQDKVLIAWDTSGSISNKDMTKMLAETNKLAATMPVDLMLFDCALQYKKAVEWNKRKVECGVLGRGGTAFQPVFDYAVEHGYKTLVIFTDGYAPAPTKSKKIKRVLWVLTPGGKCPVKWGRVVTMTEVPGE